jgi:acyl carrier protein
MAETDIEQAVIDIIAKEGSVERERITLDSTLKELDVHSLDGVQIIFALEDKFDITVPDDPNQHATGTVGQLIEGVKQLVAAKQASA